MCQLLALSCAEPTDVSFSLTGFAARGGLTDHHVDGWGVAFYEDRACRVFVDDKPACQSPVATFLQRNPIKSRNVVAHIRKATQGGARVENCHPFMRELRGQQWVFAHNGDLRPLGEPEAGPYAPVGTTDSEAAFCFVMNRLYAHFAAHPAARTDDADALFAVIQDATRALNTFGIFNFVLSNGSVQFAYCSTRLSYVIRHWPFSSARLVDGDLSVDFAERGTPTDRTAVIATTPLTDEAWTACRPGDLLMFSRGALLRRAHVAVPADVLASSKYALSEQSAVPA
ncbi:class II glutamine amidotransferase [Paraburkholderia sp. D15]|uniref:class II glutamine amidotransferase n=1 Tax=Paraburkholderia sp. D15 TaxID=2880218 RepID=UPI00247A521B|nr:class II glutamine amidotransferase [Paraburkholderia sp. D15]WGS54713.1 class II glutamine amidotransferase [Paraburkholderia sp. D15]WKF59821.1 Putative glutamine amidotransferase YafJ [Paraburkholderia busanensis]